MWKVDVRPFTSPYICCCCCFADGSRADKEEPVEMKTTSSLSLMSASEASTWKHYHCWPPETLQPKQSLCQMIITINISNVTVPWNQPPPSPDAALSCVYFFILLFKEASLFSLLLSCRSLLCHRYWPNNRAAAAVPVLFFFLFVLFLTCEGDLELRSPVGSDDLCAVLCPLCGLLICVCVCVSVFLLSINVRT